MAITDKRVFVCNSTLGSTFFKELPLKRIQSIDDAGNALLGTAQLRIKGLTEIFVIDLNKNDIDKTTNYLLKLNNHSNKEGTKGRIRVIKNIKYKYLTMASGNEPTKAEKMAKKRHLELVQAI